MKNTKRDNKDYYTQEETEIWLKEQIEKIKNGEIDSNLSKEIELGLKELQIYNTEMLNKKVKREICTKSFILKEPEDNY